MKQPDIDFRTIIEQAEESNEALLEALQKIRDIPDKETQSVIKLSEPVELRLTFSKTEAKVDFSTPLKIFSLDEGQEDWELVDSYLEKINQFDANLKLAENDFSDDVLGADFLIDYEHFNPNGGKRYFRHTAEKSLININYSISFDSGNLVINDLSFSLDSRLKSNAEQLEDIALHTEDLFNAIDTFLRKIVLNDTDSNFDEVSSNIKDQLRRRIFNSLKKAYILEIQEKVDENAAYQKRDAERKSELSQDDWMSLLPKEIFKELLNSKPSLLDQLNQNQELALPNQKSLDITSLITYIQDHQDTCSVEYIWANNGNVFKIIIEGTPFILKGTRSNKGQEKLRPLFALAHETDEGLAAFEEGLKYFHEGNISNLLILLSELYAQQIGYEATRNDLDGVSNQLTFVPTIAVCDDSGWPTSFLRPFVEGTPATISSVETKLGFDQMEMGNSLREFGIILDTFPDSQNFIITPGGRCSVIDASLNAQMEDKLESLVEKLIS